MEQAAHFIKPIVEKALEELEQANQVEIKLVKSVSNEKLFAKKIAPIVFWKDSDILISIVHEKIEYPLTAIEISNAVFARDHELQRFDGIIAAVKNNTMYAKISPVNKESDTEHGGDKDFDYHIPYALIHQHPDFDGAVPIHLDVSLIKNPVTKKLSIVEKDPTNFSCPILASTMFHDFIKIIVKTNLTSFDEKTWIKQTQKELDKEPCLFAWKSKLKCIKLPDITKEGIDKDGKLSQDPNKQRVRWMGDHIQLKINRFGHAMDPERGMLVYYSTFPINKRQTARMFFTNTKTWYNGVKEKAIDLITKDGLTKVYDYLKCFALGVRLWLDPQDMEKCKKNVDVEKKKHNDNIEKQRKKIDTMPANTIKQKKALEERKEKLKHLLSLTGKTKKYTTTLERLNKLSNSPEYDFTKLIDQYEKNTSSMITIDLSKFIKKHFNNLSKPLRVIFGFSNELLIQSATVPGKRYADPSTVESHVKFEFDRIKEPPTFDNQPPVTNLDKTPPKSEDEVTYILIHSILQTHGHEILMASYPGDQGDQKILPEEGSGKAQKRDYIDTMSKIKKTTFLIENKETFTKLINSKDIPELQKYRSNKRQKLLAKYLQERGKGKVGSTKLCVAFYKDDSYNEDELKKHCKGKIDYAFVISSDPDTPNIGTWEIVELDSSKDFEKLTGCYSMPKHFAVEK